MDLTRGQKHGSKKLKKWWNKQSKQVFEISGGPGTGKTTLIHYFIDLLGLDRNNVVFTAYIGKAVLVMRRKGNAAKTLHSTIYDVEEYYIKTPQGHKRAIRFIKKKQLDSDVVLIIVDEGSMVSLEMKLDLLSFGVPIIVLGDINQLPPVFGKPAFLSDPDVILTEIMRQKEGDPIIELCKMARLGKNIPIGRYGKRCIVIGREHITDLMLKRSSVVLCGRNKTRDVLNQHIREELFNRHSKIPEENDKLICRKNNWCEVIEDIPLINGLVGRVCNPIDKLSYNGKTISIDFQPEFMTGNYFSNILLDYPYLNSGCGNKSMDRYNDGNKFEYAYAITTQLAQGSQYPSVLVYEEHMHDNLFHRKWLNTAFSRAESLLIYVKES